MSYRIEICPNNRATCSATLCKKEGVKIMKGEIRHGVLVPFEEKQSWKYRHWGCVTPEVFHNWQITAQGDMELVDGYDTLPEDVQEKVKRALEQGHVDDDDWKGDLECNRYTGKRMQGMFVKTPKKKAAKRGDEEGDEGEASPTKKQPKKRGRAKAEDADGDAEDKPAPKRARGKKAVKAEGEDGEPEDAPPAKKARKTKTTKDEEADEDAPEPTAKKGRAKKAKLVAMPEEDGLDDEIDEKPAPPAKKGRAAKVKSAAKVDDEDLDEEPDEKPAPPARKPRAKKATKKAAAEDESEVEPEKPKAKPQRKARGKKATATDEE